MFPHFSPSRHQDHYYRFVGITVSGWLERKTAKHLQGGRKSFFDLYVRRNELPELIALPDPMPNGYAARRALLSVGPRVVGLT